MAALHATPGDGVAEAAGQNLEVLKRRLATLQNELAGLSQLLLGSASSGVIESVKKVADGGRSALAGTEKKVREWPLLSLLVAFLVGLVFGRVVQRK